MRGIDFDITSGSAFGLIGESGCGKSLTCRAILSLLPHGASATGEVMFGNMNLLRLPPRRLRQIRGAQVSMVFQDPMSSLNPLVRVGDLVAQVIQSHFPVGRRAARVSGVELLERVGIPDAGRRSRHYPNEFSGGMRQRVAIAMALAARPALLIADEPTSSLDVLVQAGILQLLNSLRDEGMSILLVSHDFGVVTSVCERVGVMYAGQLVEEGPTYEVLTKPRHPYTVALLASLPRSDASKRLVAIPGAAPQPGFETLGCAFAARCPLATEACRANPVSMDPPGEGHPVRCIHPDGAATAASTPGPDLTQFGLPR